ncbi:DUF3883 domain-containing protein [Aliarcobacter butzleri]|uniref:DUF3883 domain-containing protein n=1 Tax=Aliarcobacter butzleri TaxID=28197 RepID=UPI003F4E27EF
MSDYAKEQETFKEYNGRQVLEFLQNADDEKSNEVLIKLDTKKRTLEISNNGSECNSFSIGGIQSLMLPNFSPKKRDINRKNYIGNKGLGFRSIINWSEQITIYTNDLKIDFSYEIAKQVYTNLTSKNVPNIAFLSLPKIEENRINKWTTAIKIRYKENFLDDIKKQLISIQDEVLLFVNHINKLKIEIDDELKIIERIKDNSFVYLNEKLWTIFEYNKDSLLPKSYWENDDKEYFDLKIAIKENFNIQDKYLLYSFFPTEINIDFPFIIHGTFELDSSRNNINNSEKNSYILEKLVDFIADTAKNLTKNEVNYKALEFLTHESSNQRLKNLEFYNKIDKKINELSIFPCLNNTYKTKDEVVFIDNDFSELIQKNHFGNTFPNMLISSKESFIDLANYEISYDIDLSSIDEISKKIYDIDTRVELIYLLNEHFSNQDYTFEILIDEDNEIISKNEETYTPKFENMNNLVLPNFLNKQIKFLNKKLGDKLLDVFKIQDKKSYRELATKLSNIVNLKEYETATILERIISEAKKINTIESTKEMIQILYKNFKIKEIKIETKNIPCLSKDLQIVYSNNLFLSNSYPSGKLTEFLFADIFDKDQFLIEYSFFNFESSEIEEVERFFYSWLGVNKYSRFEKTTHSYTDNYSNFLFSSHINKPDNYSKLSYEMNKVAFLDKIKNINIEKFILWVLKDIELQNELSKKYDIRYIKSGGYVEHYLTFDAPSYILYQLYETNIFKDYLITNEKLSELVNSINIDFENELFKQYKIKKSDIESLILKIGAVEKFEEMSIERIRQVLRELEVKSPNGKQTQTIYKAVRNHQKELNDKSIKLCAKQNNELRYYNQDEVYYASSVKLPKKILTNLPIINVPPRLGKVVNFFGIKDTKRIKISIVSHEENHNLTQQFQLILAQIQPFILVIRFDKLNDDQKQNAFNELKNSQIILCDKVTYKMNEKNYELDNNDYIKEDKKYFIKIKNDRFDEIRKILDFRETFGDIIGSIFNIVDDRYERLISDDISETEEIIKRSFEYEALEEVREYLNIENEFSTFYRTIYKLKNKTFTEKNKLDDIEKIKEELCIKTNLNKLDYKNITSDDSCEVLQILLKELGISINDFNNEVLYLKIDFTKYHQIKLENCFNDNYDEFEKVLYQWCLINDKKYEFINLKGKYENADKKVENKLHINYQEKVEIFIKDNFDFTLKDEKTRIDFNKMYDMNMLNFEIEKLNNSEKSLLYFENGDEKIRKKLESDKDNSIKEIVINTDDSIPKNINKITVESSNPSNNMNKKNNYGTHNPSNEKKQKQHGYKAEQCVFNYLVKEYKKANVKWFSKESDSGHYDIRYKKNNKWFYVEVKTYSNNMFYLSKDEKKFAEKNKENYEIFLVEVSSNKKCEEAKIYIINHIDFKNNLKLVPNKYEVYYSVKAQQNLAPNS